MEFITKLSKTAVIVIYALVAVMVVATIGLIIAALNISGWFWLGAVITSILALAGIAISVAFKAVSTTIVREFGRF